MFSTDFVFKHHKILLTFRAVRLNLATMWNNTIFERPNEQVSLSKQKLGYTLRSGNDVTEGITQESPMGASWVIPRKVDKMV